MTRIVPAMLFAIWLSSSSALAADEFNCSSAAMPMDFVICSKPELIEANSQMAAAWYKARAGLKRVEKKALANDQREWMDSVSAACGLPQRGKTSAEVILRSQGGVLQNMIDRTGALLKIAEENYFTPAQLSKTLWSEGDTKVIAHITDEGEDIEVHRGETAKKITGGMMGQTRVLWKKTKPHSSGPDLLIVVFGGGSAACGEYVSFQFSSQQPVQEFPFCETEEADFSIDERGEPGFRVNFAIQTLMADWIHDVTAVGIPMVWNADAFAVDTERLKVSAPAAGSFKSLKQEIQRELSDCGAPAYPPDGYECSARRTTEILMYLVFAGRQTEAKALLAQAWPTKMPGRDKLWQDFLNSLSSHQKWAKVPLGGLSFQ